MKFGLIFGEWSLTYRKELRFADIFDDPRGLTGSEVGVVRVAEELARTHDVTLYTVADCAEWRGVKVRPTSEIPDTSVDALISWSEPDLLCQPWKHERPHRVCYQMLNDFSYCRPGFHEHVDQWVSPSRGHMEMVLGKEHPVHQGDPHKPNPEQWSVVPLGCDPELYNAPKVPGRVVYTSSPDRGLHLLLQQWPRIKRAVPHAELRVFYRLRAWLDHWHTAVFNPAVEGQRYRAHYIEECLRRFAETPWLADSVKVYDSVSRNRLAEELAQAEVLAYPCDPTSWTKGFSCSLLEGLAARACPVTFAVDALPSVYAGALRMLPRDDLKGWTESVIEGLSSEVIRTAWNKDGERFAKEHTWKHTAEKLAAGIASYRSRSETAPASSKT